MIELLKRRIRKAVFPDSTVIYAQNGEDLIMSHYFYKNGIKNPSYLDIGANHPRYISNTFYYYLKGSRGVCVEPNPKLAKLISKIRPLDKVINQGVGDGQTKEADFYIFPDHAHGLSTFSKEEAAYWANTGMKGTGKIQYEKVVKIPLITINEILQNYFDKTPEILSMDVEGLDLSLLKTIDFNNHRPLFIVVETLIYDEHQNESRNEHIVDFLLSKNYKVYADTHVNTIFLRG